MKTILALCCSLLLTGCINVETIQHHTLPVSHSDKALVYFYREGGIEAGIYSYHILEKGRELASIRSGSFYFIYASPGEHVYELHAPLSPPIQRRLTLRNGNTYYLLTGVFVGSISANLTFSIMNEQEGAAALDHLRMMNPPFTR